MESVSILLHIKYATPFSGNSINLNSRKLKQKMGRPAGKLKIFPLLIMYLMAVSSCNKDETIGRKFGLVLTVDDGYVGQWYEYLDDLEAYNANLTFYISNYQQLSENEKSKLESISEKGHAIEFHGTHHISVDDYLEDHSVEDYLNEEILEGLVAMKNDGYMINHFAYPCGISNDTIDSLLLGHFLSVRKLVWADEENKLKDLQAAHRTPE